MTYNQYIDKHGRLIKEHTDENNEIITDYVGVFVKEYTDKNNVSCKKYIDHNGVVLEIRERPEGHKGLWIGQRTFLRELSVRSYLLKQFEPIFTEFDIDKRGLWKEMINANKEFEKSKEEDIELYNKLTKKIEDDENKQS
ncbi:hypothetical protein FQP34_00105 [Peribacillus simplex]|uniref:Uncharacterized protein n=1 Tax=Peribacillus simplex TaxID=1478 RepID=A0A8B5Y3U3_9BACI|nr:hypothetical protein [Peribacillus simplex]MED3911403.1 hypothetical protein [Peribacillus simplex]TVX83697.1 hypothetical protein FQP34_00105 [Peribacillus simplex]